MTHFLTVDVGNSQWTLVLYQGHQRLVTQRVATRPFQAAEEVVACWTELLKPFGMGPSQVVLSVSSSVPPLEETLQAAIDLFRAAFVHRVLWGSPHGFSASDTAAQEIGADLIAGLVGARALVSGPFLVVDCGTATTLTLVDAQDRIVGVAILPGLKTQWKSLTLDLPHLFEQESLALPPHPYGNTTLEALQSGILYGHGAAVEGMIESYRKLSLGPAVAAVACGGLFTHLSTLCPSVDIQDAELVNDGCRILAERAFDLSQERL